MRSISDREINVRPAILTGRELSRADEAVKRHAADAEQGGAIIYAIRQCVSGRGDEAGLALFRRSCSVGSIHNHQPSLATSAVQATGRAVEPTCDCRLGSAVDG